MNEREAAERRAAELQFAYESAFERLTALLYEEDPVGISSKENPGEYEPEAGAILPRLMSCRSVDDVEQVVHSEFVRWFDAETAGPVERYRSIAARVWLEVVPCLKVWS